jgi:hypothetical protein
MITLGQEKLRAWACKADIKSAIHSFIHGVSKVRYAFDMVQAPWFIHMIRAPCPQKTTVCKRVVHSHDSSTMPTENHRVQTYALFC